MVRPGHSANSLLSEPVDWQSRAHFFAVAAQQMRRLLIDHARARHADKRGGRRIRLSITELEGLAAPEPEDLLALDQAIGRLETLDPSISSNCQIDQFATMVAAIDACPRTPHQLRTRIAHRDAARARAGSSCGGVDAREP